MQLVHITLTHEPVYVVRKYSIGPGHMTLIANHYAIFHLDADAISIAYTVIPRSSVKLEKVAYRAGLA